MLKILALVLVVGAAAPVVHVPNVVGLPYEHAKERLHARGLEVGIVVPGHCPRPVGVVCRQNPQAGRTVDITEPIHLIVSMRTACGIGCWPACGESVPHAAVTSQLRIPSVTPSRATIGID